jgi:hypothetical protein
MTPSRSYRLQANDSGHKLRALTFQLQEALGHLQVLNALISTAPTAHASFTYYWAKCHDMGSSHPANQALGPTCRLEWES